MNNEDASSHCRLFPGRFTALVNDVPLGFRMSDALLNIQLQSIIQIFLFNNPPPQFLVSASVLNSIEVTKVLTYDSLKT